MKNVLLWILCAIMFIFSLAITHGLSIFIFIIFLLIELFKRSKKTTNNVFTDDFGLIERKNEDLQNEHEKYIFKIFNIIQTVFNDRGLYSETENSILTFDITEKTHNCAYIVFARKIPKDIATKEYPYVIASQCCMPIPKSRRPYYTRFCCATNEKMKKMNMQYISFCIEYFDGKPYCSVRFSITDIKGFYNKIMEANPKHEYLGERIFGLYDLLKEALNEYTDEYES